jgi:hypothetical protein
MNAAGKPGSSKERTMRDSSTVGKHGPPRRLEWLVTAILTATAVGSCGGSMSAPDAGRDAAGRDGVSDGATHPDANGGCVQNGVHYNVGDLWDVGCNVCNCRPDEFVLCSSVVCLPDGGGDGG